MTEASPGVAPPSGAEAATVVDIREMARTFPGPPQVEALRPVDLAIGRGEYLSIVGPSGSGKSTLLHLLGLLDRPTAGTYNLAGVETTTATERQRTALRARYIGFVFQSFHLLPHRSVLENVLLATLYSGVDRATRAQRATEALQRVHLEHRSEFFPTTLSGGEQQRVAIARAVVASPTLLLADEPTGNLDSANSRSVMDLFDELHRDGLTLVVITHDDNVSHRAQRSVRITDGQLVHL